MPPTPAHRQRASGETGADHQLIPGHYGAQHVTPTGPLTLGHRQGGWDHDGTWMQFGAAMVVIQLKTVHHDPQPQRYHIGWTAKPLEPERRLGTPALL